MSNIRETENFKVALGFEDGVTRFISVTPGQTVADASYRARINIPLDCRDGACGTCMAFCVSGAFDGGDYIEDALTDQEADAGFCLPCQMSPRSDLVLQIQGTSEMAKTTASAFEASIERIERHSPTAYGLTLRVDDRDKLGFLAGQYVNIDVPGSAESRSYSFSSGPKADEVSFLIRIAEKGLMTEYLRDTARVGDRLGFTGPRGSFFLREVKRPLLMLAGGTGLAPILSMLEVLAQNPPSHPVHLVYGVSADRDVVGLAELESYTQRIEGFTYDWCVSDSKSQAPKKGYVTAHLEQHHLNDGDVDVYLCGPPPMVEAVRSHFEHEGITPAGFHFEKFAVAAPATTLVGASA